MLPRLTTIRLNEIIQEAGAGVFQELRLVRSFWKVPAAFVLLAETRGLGAGVVP